MKQKKLKKTEIIPELPNTNAEEKRDNSPIIPQRTKLKYNLKIFERFEQKLTETQKKFLELVLNKNTKMVFVSGPAGTAKTYMAVYAALKLLNERKMSDIIYVRSAVESADHKLGFLPGEINDKMAPYIEPLLDKLEELLSRSDIDSLTKDKRITGMPVGFLRGRNWNAKVVIADECISGKHFVQTSNGKIRIQHLHKMFVDGESLPMLKTYNESKKLFEDKNIVSVINKGEKEVISVILGNRNITCTPDHKFLTEVGWVEAQNLTPFTPVIANNDKKLQTLDVMNSDQLQVFLGSFLGDGHVQEVGNNRYRLRVVHGAKQKEYCEWKASLFHSNLGYIPENGYAKNPAFKFTTKCYSLPSNIPMDKKMTCPKWILDKLDARGIAIWYMDDGNINESKNVIRLSTCSFNIETQKLFVEKFKTIGLDCSIKTDKGDDYLYHYLEFNAKNSRMLLDMISPYIHENLEYKINGRNKKYVFSDKFLNYRHIIPDKVISTPGRSQVVYDIEVEDNHNFIITSGTRGVDKKSYSGVVVHNCQNMTWKELVTFITRIGEFSKVIILGDPLQSDINGKSGFIKMLDLFGEDEDRNEGIYTFRLTDEDVVRSRLVRHIIKKLEKVKS